MVAGSYTVNTPKRLALKGFTNDGIAFDESLYTV